MFAVDRWGACFFFGKKRVYLIRQEPMLALAAVGGLFLGIPHLQRSDEAALAPKKHPPQDGPAGQDPGWLESPPHPPSPPIPPPDTRSKGCDMQGVYCKNETKAGSPGDDSNELKVEGPPDHSGNAMKKLKKKLKAQTKINDAQKRIAGVKEIKKKLKKKQKAKDKILAADKRKDAASKWNDRKDAEAAAAADEGEDAEEDADEDAAVSFLQEEETAGEESEEDAGLADGEGGGSGKKKLKKKIKAQEKMLAARKRAKAAAAAKDTAKKIKKKIKADEKQIDADDRKNAAQDKKAAEAEAPADASVMAR